MKIHLYLFLMFLLISTALAQEEVLQVTLNKERYSPGETIQIHITSTATIVVPITLSNIKLLDPKGGDIPIAQGFLKINNNDYYTYFDLPSTLRNDTYTLRIVNVRYQKEVNGNAYYNTDIPLVIQKEDTVLSVRPAIFFKRVEKLEQPGFQLVVSNKGTVPL